MVCIVKVIVYVWQEDFGLGHASMNIMGADDNQTYVSFWPGDERKKIKYVFGGEHRSKMIEKYSEDRDLIGKEADIVIDIYNLPNPKNYRITSYKTSWETGERKIPWSLMGTNCCYVVIDNLKDISGISPPEKWKSWHGISTPINVINYANFINKTFTKELTLQRIEYSINKNEVECKAFIVNARNSETSESLQLKLWATTSLFDGKHIEGYVFAKTHIEPLKAGNRFTIESKVDYDKPPAGEYYVVATLNEHEGGDKWPIHDWIYINKMHRF
jgi:hypothetical protein